MTEHGKASQHEFKAEVKQLLDILVHSLYTNKEIFLRELLSNSSDALDKLRFEVNRGTEIADKELPLEIKITFDKDNKLLVITDTGIGMSRDEVVDNIGTIARSGSAEFLKLAAGQKTGLDNIIGKFGVGFYSVFMVAKEVVLQSKSFQVDEPPVQWRSDGLGTYQLQTLDGDIKRGTRVEVHLKDDAVEFADKFRLEGIIKKHSNFISFPIYVEAEQINTIAAIWREPKSSLKPEQYQEFYKFLTLDTEEPLETLHISVDAPIQFNSLLFIPQHSADIWGLPREQWGLDLYVRRVLIQHRNKDLLPEYLSFVRGVVDSEDLPLNISRETLQENLLINKIAANLAKQILSQLQRTAKEDKEKFAKFWEAHGKIFKMGYNDFAHRDKFAELLRFNSSKCADSQELVSFEEYIDRAQEGQKEIYYVFGPSREAFLLNPHMEIFKSKGLEVLYLFEPVDEFVMDGLRKFKDFDLKAIEHVDPQTLEKFTQIESEQAAEPLSLADENAFDKFLERIKAILGDRVTAVKASSRLIQSPCCLVNPDGAMTSSMEKILRIVSKDTTIPPKIFEVNKDHRLIRNLLAIYKTNPDDDYLQTAVEQLFDSFLLLEGYLKDPHAMVGRLQDILNKSSSWYLVVKK